METVVNLKGGRKQSLNSRC